ncbi:MAG TPA: polyprenyl synthetase family protein [Thermoanaerobaculia bacterium]|nr:polyprenyl synthetase family protein [Thermoanaerobaculia bacterium]
MSDYFSDRRARIDARLHQVASDAVMPPALREPVLTALRSAGKRVRGILTLAAGESCGAKPDRLLDAAAAFEMIHTSSLILDDLPAMDDAALRRGEPAIHRRFGEDLAILTAVALLNHGYGLLARNHAELRPRRWPLHEILDRLVAAIGWDGSVGGEAVDLHSERATLDFPTLEYVHSRKTGALFVAAAATGAMLANARAPRVRAIEAYAKNLGLAFQITDDILDVTSTREQLGKDVGKDEGKLTFVRLARLDGARQLNAELIDTSLAAIARLGSAAAPLRDLARLLRDRTR